MHGSGKFSVGTLNACKSSTADKVISNIQFTVEQFRHVDFHQINTSALVLHGNLMALNCLTSIFRYENNFCALLFSFCLVILRAQQRHSSPLC